MLKDTIKPELAPRRGGNCFKEIDMAESDNILTKLQDLLV